MGGQKTSETSSRVYIKYIADNGQCPIGFWYNKLATVVYL
jgi:hypothetical protein